MELNLICSVMGVLGGIICAIGDMRNFSSQFHMHSTDYLQSRDEWQRQRFSRA